MSVHFFYNQIGTNFIQIREGKKSRKKKNILWMNEIAMTSAMEKQNTKNMNNIEIIRPNFPTQCTMEMGKCSAFKLRHNQFQQNRDNQKIQGNESMPLFHPSKVKWITTHDNESFRWFCCRRRYNYAVFDVSFRLFLVRWRQEKRTKRR